jgi:hypothetical protein
VVFRGEFYKNIYFLDQDSTTDVRNTEGPVFREAGFGEFHCIDASPNILPIMKAMKMFRNSDLDQGIIKAFKARY